MFNKQILRWLDSNRRPLGLDATALPTVPQPQRLLVSLPILLSASKPNQAKRNVTRHEAAKMYLTSFVIGNRTPPNVKNDFQPEFASKNIVLLVPWSNRIEQRSKVGHWKNKTCSKSLALTELVNVQIMSGFLCARNSQVWVPLTILWISHSTKIKWIKCEH